MFQQQDFKPLQFQRWKLGCFQATEMIIGQPVDEAGPKNCQLVG